jgi:hypothetical protein
MYLYICCVGNNNAKCQDAAAREQLVRYKKTLARLYLTGYDFFLQLLRIEQVVEYEKQK